MNPIHPIVVSNNDDDVNDKSSEGNDSNYDDSDDDDNSDDYDSDDDTYVNERFNENTIDPCHELGRLRSLLNI